MNEHASDSAGGRQVAVPSAGGVAEQLADLLQEHGGKVLGHLGRRFPSLSQEERHDVLVDALLAFGRTYDDQRGPAGPWLLLLAHQRAIDWLRQASGYRAPIGWLPADLVSTEPSPPRRLEQQERIDEIHGAIARLSTLERTVIEADLEVDGTANARLLARQLDTTERAVYAARARAREKLARWLDRS